MKLIYGWTESNGMKINLSKTFSMRVGMSNYEATYTAPDNTEIRFKDELKDLGIVLSSDGSFKDHIKAIKKKAFHKMGYILRTFKNRNSQFMSRIFKILVLPYLEHGS